MVIKCVLSGCNHNQDGICQAESIELIHSNNYEGEDLECTSYQD